MFPFNFSGINQTRTPVFRFTVILNLLQSIRNFDVICGHVEILEVTNFLKKNPDKSRKFFG